jgi:hypothetical protein
MTCFVASVVVRRCVLALENEEPAPWDRLYISAFSLIGSVRSVRTVPWRIFSVRVTTIRFYSVRFLRFRFLRFHGSVTSHHERNYLNIRQFPGVGIPEILEVIHGESMWSSPACVALNRHHQVFAHAHDVEWWSQLSHFSGVESMYGY